MLKRDPGLVVTKANVSGNLSCPQSFYILVTLFVTRCGSKLMNLNLFIDIILLGESLVTCSDCLYAGLQHNFWVLAELPMPSNWRPHFLNKAVLDIKFEETDAAKAYPW